MAGLNSSMVVLIIMMVASMHLQSTVAQTRHVVGDAMGWTVPNGGAADYTNWASRQNFTVGDTLFFNFTTGFHNVAEVSQAAYGPCATANPISITTTGPATVALTIAGTHHYICTVGGHCSLGQKLTVNVTTAAAAPTSPPPTPTPTRAPVSPPTITPTPAPSTTTPPPTSSPTPSPVEANPPSPPTSGPSPSGSTTPSPAGSTTPSPSGSATPPPAGSTTPPPPPSSTAPSSAAMVSATFLAIALAFFY